MPVITEKKLDKNSFAKVIAKEHNLKRDTVYAVPVSAIVALVCFIILNVFLWQVAGQEKKVKGTANDTTMELWSGAGSVDLTVNDFRRLKQRPTIVLLGSSLVMHPFWAMDAELDHGIADIFHYHNSRALTDALAQAKYPGQRVFNMAVFGAMASDAYIYADKFLQGDKKPDYLVLGIAPRDFSDADLPTPMATFTFRKLVNLTNFNRYANMYMPSWQDKADFLATHACFFYGKRWRLQHEVQKAFDKILSPALAHNTGVAGAALLHDPKGANAVLSHDAKLIDPQSESKAGFMLAGTQNERWLGSAKEYRRRYQNIGDKDLHVQMSFLARILSTCQARGIKVVLMNMPLTALNRSLLPPEFYDRFRTRIKSIASEFTNVSMLDLGDAPEFTNADFWDTAHLNQSGGHKLLRHLAPAIASANFARRLNNSDALSF